MKFQFEIFFVALLLIGLHAPVYTQSPKSEGKYTSEVNEPKNAHIMNVIDLGRIKSIRGTLRDSGSWIPIPEGTIISVYLVGKETSRFIFSYFPGASGRFNFPKLKRGNYVLKTGTMDGGFNQVDVKLTLAPSDKKSSSKDLEILLEVGT